MYFMCFYNYNLYNFISRNPFALMINFTYYNFYSKYLVYVSGATVFTPLFSLSKAFKCPPSINIRIMHGICFLATAKCKGVLPYISFDAVLALNFCNKILAKCACPYLAAQCKAVILNSSISNAR